MRVVSRVRSAAVVFPIATVLSVGQSGRPQAAVLPGKLLGGDTVFYTPPAFGEQIAWNGHVVWGDSTFAADSVAGGNLSSSLARPADTPGSAQQR
jgi:hypothetical protein